MKEFPSCPVSANTGTKARMMIAIAKKIGRPTCFDADEHYVEGFRCV